MLRTRMVVPAMALKVACQVGASVAATLIASMIFAALPKATVPVERPAAELTSGGKFAARIPGAENADARNIVALKALPVMAEASAQVPLATVDMAWDAAAKPPGAESIDRPSRPRLRLPLRSEARRSADARGGDMKRPADPVAAVPGPKSELSAAVESGAPKADDGMVPRIASSVRSLWSMTSSAGGSLLSRVLP